MAFLSDNPIYCAQLERVANALPLRDIIIGDILITGASGLIGSAVVDLLIWMRKNAKFVGNVMAAGRSLKRLEDRFGRCDGLRFIKYDDVISGSCQANVGGLILAASPASPNLFISEADAVIKTNTKDVECVLARHEKLMGTHVVYVSSSEVYGLAQAPVGGYIEDVLGRIEERDLRSCYAISKRKAEQICQMSARQGLSISIARPGHIYGPTALKSDRRVSSAWAYDVAHGKDIVMKSDGSQLRSYTHCLDCAGAILTILVRGKPGGVYNVANSNSIISIKNLADILVSSAGVCCRVEKPTELERQSFNPMKNSSLNASKLEGLGWTGVIGAEEGLSSTVEILTEQETGSGKI